MEKVQLVFGVFNCLQPTEQTRTIKEEYSQRPAELPDRKAREGKNERNKRLKYVLAPGRHDTAE